jgi:hypothetical protein
MSEQNFYINEIEVGVGARMLDFMGNEWVFSGVAQPAGGGSSGKVRVTSLDGETTAIFFPGVFGGVIR